MRIHPTTAVILAIVAQIVVWQLCAYWCMPVGHTISQRVKAWTVLHPWLPWAYVAGAVYLGLHWFVWVER